MDDTRPILYGFLRSAAKMTILVPAWFVAVAACAGAEWKLDFTSSCPPIHWWSPAKQDNTCSLAWVTNAATGRQALEAYWDGKGTWMHVYQDPLSKPMAPFDRLLVRVKLSSDMPLSGVRGCSVRIQDADRETFYFGDTLRQKNIWKRTGAREAFPPTIGFSDSFMTGEV